MPEIRAFLGFILRRNIRIIRLYFIIGRLGERCPPHSPNLQRGRCSLDPRWGLAAITEASCTLSDRGIRSWHETSVTSITHQNPYSVTSNANRAALPRSPARADGRGGGRRFWGPHFGLLSEYRPICVKVDYADFIADLKSEYSL